MNVRLIAVHRGAEVRIAGLVRSRFMTALWLSMMMIAIYFGFMALFAFDKQLLGVILAPGLSLGILLGPLVIFSAFILCLVYVWTNAFLDPRISGHEGHFRPGRGTSAYPLSAAE